MTTFSSIHQPQLPKIITALVNKPTTLQDFDEFDALALTSVDLTGQHAAHLTWQGVTCRHVCFADTYFDAIRLTDVLFNSCNCANAHWETLTVQRLAVNECQLIGFDTPDARWQDVTFTNCMARYAKFRFSKFRRVRFDSCDLHNADFQGSDLSGVIFDKCDLTDAQLSGTTLQGTDFRSSTIEKMRVGIAELPGAIVEPVQAAYVAGLLGVVVKWVGEE